ELVTRRPRSGDRNPPRGDSGADRRLRSDPARLAIPAREPLRRDLHHRRRRHRPAPRTGTKEESMSVTTPSPSTASTPTRSPEKRSLGSRALEALLTQRIVLLAVLIVILLVVMTILDATGALSGSYNSDYLAAALIN